MTKKRHEKARQGDVVEKDVESESTLDAGGLTQAQVGPSRHEIAMRAFQIFEAEGSQDGHALDHWLRAEAELRNVQPSG